MTTLIQSPDDVPSNGIVPADAKPGDINCYHTQEDCRHLTQCETTRPLTWDDARTTIRECNYCQTMTIPPYEDYPENAVISGGKSPAQLSVYHTSESCQSYPMDPKPPGEVDVVGRLRECRLCERID